MFAFVLDSVGGGEWLVLLAVVLIVVGPKNLPSAARKMGQIMTKLRRAADEFKRQLMTMDEEMKKTADEIKRDYIDIPDDSVGGDRAVSESAEATADPMADGPYGGDYPQGYPEADYYGMTDENGHEVASTPDGEVASAQSQPVADGNVDQSAQPTVESGEENGQDTGNTQKS